MKPLPFVQSFFDIHAPRQPHAVILQLSLSSFVCFIFGSWEVALRVFCANGVSPLYKKYFVLVHSGWCFQPCDHELDLDISVCENSTNQ